MLPALFAAITVVALSAASDAGGTEIAAVTAIDAAGARSDDQERLSAPPPVGLPILPARAPLPASSASSSGSFQLLAMGFRTGAIYDLDPATAVLSNERATGISLPSGLSVSPEGILYVSRAFLGADPTTEVALYRIDDPALGTATPIGPAGLENLYEGDLEFDPVSGRLYGLYTADFSLNHANLLEYDLETGVATQIGEIAPIAGFDPSALAFDARGDLYVFSRCPDELHLVDPATAIVLATVPLTPPINSIIAGMDFDPATGVLYLASGFPSLCSPGLIPPALYRIDPVTGDVFQVGALATDISALLFAPIQ